MSILLNCLKKNRKDSHLPDSDINFSDSGRGSPYETDACENVNLKNYSNLVKSKVKNRYFFHLIFLSLLALVTLILIYKYIHSDGYFQKKSTLFLSHNPKNTLSYQKNKKKLYTPMKNDKNKSYLPRNNITYKKDLKIYELAIQFSNSKNYTSAIKVLRNYSPHSFNKVIYYSLLAKLYYVTGQIKLSITVYKMLLENNSKIYQLWLGLALSELKLNLLKDAKISFEKIKKIKNVPFNVVEYVTSQLIYLNK